MTTVIRAPSAVRMHQHSPSPHSDSELVDNSSQHPDAVPLVVLVIGMGQPVVDSTRQLLGADGTIRAIEQGSERVNVASEAALRPQVVLLGVDASRDDAVDAVREAAAKWRPAPVLALTASEDRSRNRQLVRAGARGVVTESRQAGQLISAIHRVRDGEIWLARACMSQLIDELAASSEPLPAHLATAEGLDRLTERERDVVALIARGMHNKAIAGELGITDHTVRHHLTAIFAKLGVSDRLELAVYALRHRDA
jgi:two-component system, NarL family, nitrate/nitrite response regulator NarL